MLTQTSLSSFASKSGEFTLDCFFDDSYSNCEIAVPDDDSAHRRDLAESFYYERFSRDELNYRCISCLELLRVVLQYCARLFVDCGDETLETDWDSCLMAV